FVFFFFQAEDGIRDATVTGVQTCALPILEPPLCRLASVRTEDGLPRERRRSGQRMDADDERIMDAVEGDRLADRRIDHPRVADRSEERRVGKERRSRQEAEAEKARERGDQ